MIKRIVKIHDEYANESAVGASIGHRKGGSNPFYDQTATGLRLETYYCLVHKLHTP